MDEEYDKNVNHVHCRNQNGFEHLSSFEHGESKVKMIQEVSMFSMKFGLGIHDNVDLPDKQKNHDQDLSFESDFDIGLFGVDKTHDGTNDIKDGRLEYRLEQEVLTHKGPCVLDASLSKSIISESSCRMRKNTDHALKFVDLVHSFPEGYMLKSHDLNLELVGMELGLGEGCSSWEFDLFIEVGLLGVEEKGLVESDEKNDTEGKHDICFEGGALVSDDFEGDFLAYFFAEPDVGKEGDDGFEVAVHKWFCSK